MSAPSLSTMLERISQTQTPLAATYAVLLGLAVLAVVALPTWLVFGHVDTMAHEGTHALVRSVTGGTVQSVTMKPDGSGLTVSKGGGRVMSGVAGYLGPSAFGLAAAYLISIGRIVAVLWLAILLLTVLLLMIRNLFGFCSVAITGFFLYLVARYGSVGAETVVAYLLTWFLLVSGLRSVLGYSGREGDAANLVKATYLPRVLCIGVWLTGTTVALVLGGSLLV
jgi:hypothetical protein